MYVYAAPISCLLCFDNKVVYDTHLHTTLPYIRNYVIIVYVAIYLNCLRGIIFMNCEHFIFCSYIVAIAILQEI